MAPPEAEVETFFAQWLDRPGAPILAAEVAGDELVLTQVQEGTPYHLELEVELVRPAGVEELVVDVRERKTKVGLSDGAVTEVRLDPRKRILMWRPAYGERP